MNHENYPKVDSWVDLPALERDILRFWSETGAFDRLREQTANGEPWSFLDGPITANNPMGVHHAWGRTLKDLYGRYWAMNGRQLRWQNGFDCQGLWVEVEVEKEKGFQSKRDIEAYGIERFVHDCKERVLTFAARQTSQSIRLGYWMDWDAPETLLALRDALHDGTPELTVKATNGNTLTGTPEQLIGKLGTPEWGGSYFTFSTVNNHTIWAFLKKCHDQGSLYRGTDVMPWCSRCGTGLSQMEITEGRKITEHTSVFVRFPLRGREKAALLVWTTTPWTLTSNVAAAVNPELDYLEIRHGEWTYYAGKGNWTEKRVRNLEAQGAKLSKTLQSLESLVKGLPGEPPVVVRELKGSELVGLAYDGPFDHLPAQAAVGGLTPYGTDGEPQVASRDQHRVIAWDVVSASEGTGIVHIAPGCGAEDAALGRLEGLVRIAPLDDSGHYVDGFDWLTGRNVSGVADDIVADLKQRGVLLARESYPHVYPHCWRCKQELVFRLVDEWFIRMDWRDRIQAVVPTITWIPADGEARESDWLKNMGDWMISKKRYWGLALPIWVCTEPGCHHFDVIGGEDELKSRAIAGWEAFEGHTPHRPHIDHVRIACGRCGGVAERVKDVGNPWLDAGIVPYSTTRYTSDPDYWATWVPADLVLECFPGQFRNWFYALLAMSTMMADKRPFKTLLGHALVRDEHGEEMHKSKGNAIWFDDAAEEYGADVMRWLYAGQDPVQNLNFGPGPLREVRGGFLNQLWNTHAFYVNYARLEGFVPTTDRTPFADRPDFDRWILTELQDTIGAVRGAIEAHQNHKAVRAIEAFLESLSNWYVRHNRRRYWKVEAGGDSRAAFETLYECLDGLVRLAAPILAFTAERLYQNMTRSVLPDAPVSVFLTGFPTVDATQRDPELAEQMRAILRINSLALAARETAKLKVRQPLARLVIGPATEIEAQAAHRFEEMLREDLNVKAVEVTPVAAPSPLTYEVKANFKTLGKRAGKLMKGLSALIAAEGDALRRSFAAGEAVVTVTVDGEPFELEAADLLLQATQPAGQAVAEEKGTWCAVDTAVTHDLEIEGLMREVQRRIQVLRKDEGLEIEDRVHLVWQSDDPDLVEVFAVWGAAMQAEVLAVSLTRGEGAVDIGVAGKPLRASLRKA